MRSLLPGGEGAGAGDSGWSQEDSPLTPGDVKARQQNTSTNIVIVNWEIGDNETYFVFFFTSFAFCTNKSRNILYDFLNVVRLSRLRDKDFLS